MLRRTVLSAALALVAVFITQLGGTGCLPQFGGTAGLTSAFNLPPVPVISADLTRGVAPLTVTFNSDRSTDDGVVVSRQWDFGDGGTSVDIRPRHTFTRTGKFTVTLTLTDDGGATASRSLEISVTEAPVAVIRLDRSAAEAAPATINFDGSASFDPDGTVEKYRWDFGDGAFETLPVVPHTFSQPGTYRVRLTVTDNVGVTASTDTLISVGIPVPAIELLIPPPQVTNIVVTKDSPLWIQGVFSVEPGVPSMIRAGLDGDADACDSIAVLMDAATLRVVDTLEGHQRELTDAAFSADGARVLTASLDGTAILFDALTLAQSRVFSPGSTVTAVALSPTGTELAYALETGRIVVANVPDGRTLRELTRHTASVGDLKFSPAGDELLSAGRDGRAVLWSVSDGRILRDFEHEGPVNAVTFSPADPNMVIAGDDLGEIRIWNVTSGALANILRGHSGPITSLDVSDTGQALVSGSSDGTARLWNPVLGVHVMTYSGHQGEVRAVGFSSDAQQVVTGGADGTVRVWDSVTGVQTGQGKPCLSPVVAVEFSPDDATILAAVAAKSDIQLDVDPPALNDLNITFPRKLLLTKVAALDGGDVPPGTYRLWAEIDTDRTDPVRTYANAVIQVVSDFTTEISDSSRPPTIPLVDDRASIVVNPEEIRQIFDLGPVRKGDRLFLSLLGQPGFEELYEPSNDFSLMILDADKRVYVWYQLGYILFSREARLIIDEDSPHFYVVSDGGQSVNVRFQRQTGLSSARSQRVWVNFEGGVGLRVSGIFPVNIPPLNAADFNSFFTPPKKWGAAETKILKERIMEKIRSLYAGYAVQFTGSNESTTPPALPYQTMHVGGSYPGGGLLGIADYIDPRNETLTGHGLTFALSIGQLVTGSSVKNKVTTLQALGDSIGVVAAHEIGHLLGLRHTEDPGDIMQSGGCGPNAGDPTIPRVFKLALVADCEQINILPPFDRRSDSRMPPATWNR